MSKIWSVVVDMQPLEESFTKSKGIAKAKSLVAENDKQSVTVIRTGGNENARGEIAYQHEVESDGCKIELSICSGNHIYMKSSRTDGYIKIFGGGDGGVMIVDNIQHESIKQKDVTLKEEAFSLFMSAHAAIDYENGLASVRRLPKRESQTIMFLYLAIVRS